MKFHAITWKLLKRDWQANELGTYLLAIFIAMLCTSSIQLYVDRVQRALNQEASAIIGGDLVITSTQPISENLQQTAKAFDLITTNTISFLTMVRGNNQFVMTDVKAVTNNYPLRGQLKIANNINQSELITHDIPKPGEAWAQLRLLQKLKLAVGDKINIGKSSLTITKIITYEPDRPADFLIISPRVIINQQNLAATQIIQPGSRINYRFMVAGSKAKILQYQNTVRNQLSIREKIITPLRERRGLRSIIDKALDFLSLISIAGVLIAAIAISLAMDRYVRRHQKTAALLRCFGAIQRQINTIFILQIVALGLIAMLLGTSLGLIGQKLVANLLADFFSIPLPAASWSGLYLSFIIGLFLIIGFALPPLTSLRQATTNSLLHHQKTPIKRQVTWMVIITIALTLILQWQIQNLTLIFWFFAGLAGCLLLLTGLSYALINLSANIKTPGLTWRFGIKNIARRQHSNTAITISLGLVLLILLSLQLLSQQLFQEWRTDIPADTPNYFLINLSQPETTLLEQFFSEHQIKAAPIYPIIRGRLSQRNGKPILTTLNEQQQQDNSLYRELNLTWSDILPPHNTLVNGRWWPPHHQQSDQPKQLPQISVEQELAQRLGLSLGDTLTFDIATKKVTGVITNFRSLDWRSFKPNFFFIFPEKALKNFPATYITSFYLAPQQGALLDQLVSQLPSSTLIDINDIISRINNIVNNATHAIHFILLFTLLIALLIFYASIQLSIEQRRHDTAILRAIGATHRQVQIILIIEFTLIGILAGLVAAFAANILNVLLAYQSFTIKFSWHWWPMFIVPLAAGILATLIGMLLANKIVNTPATSLLRTYQ